MATRGGLPVLLRRAGRDDGGTVGHAREACPAKLGSPSCAREDGDMLQGASTAATGLPGPRSRLSLPQWPRWPEPGRSRRSATTDLRALGQPALRLWRSTRRSSSTGDRRQGTKSSSCSKVSARFPPRGVMPRWPYWTSCLRIILVDGESTALLVNRRAEQILSEQDGFGTQDGKLSAARPMDTARLRRMIARTWHLARGSSSHASDGLQLTRPSGRRPLVIRIVPLRPKIQALAVLISDPETRTPVGRELVAPALPVDADRGAAGRCPRRG